MLKHHIHTLVLFTAAVFTLFYFRIALPHGQPTIGHTFIQDADVDHLITVGIYRGEGLYSDFSIVYPPGRYIIQAALLYLFSPALVITSVFKISTTLVFFPTLLFLLSFLLYKSILTNDWKKGTSLAAYGLALATSASYLTFIRSAQEVHLAVVLFFMSLFLPKKWRSYKTLIIGFLFGFVAWLRIDIGILLFLAGFTAIITNFKENKKDILTASKSFILGVFFVWVPTILAIIFNGSLVNFLYDTLILGLIHQPRVMSLAIPENDLGLVFLSSMIFLLTSAATLFLDSFRFTDKLKRGTLQTFGVFASLSYVGALGRSDEAHLWFGLVWISAMAVYAAYRIITGLMKRERITFKTVLISALFFLILSKLIIFLKSPSIFLISSMLVFFVLQKLKPHAYSVLIGGLAATLLVFHSLSYLRLRFSLIKPSPDQGASHSWLTHEEDELWGFKVNTSSKTLLKKIRTDIPQDTKYLFVFPENLFITEQLNLKNPTRYQLLWQTRSDRTEAEVIRSLQETETKYFLVFPERAKERGGPTWQWILENTELFKTYLDGEKEIEMRKLN